MTGRGERPPRRAFRRGGGVAALLAVALTGCAVEGAPVDDLDGPGAAPQDRPDTPGTSEQFRFDPGDVVERYRSASGTFLIHFARKGRNAVSDVDANANNVPDFVEEVAGVYEQVVHHYRDDLGFRAPLSDEGIADNGGDGAFDVYLVDFAGVGDGTFRVDTCGPQDPDACIGHMVQENDYKGYGYASTLEANRILGSHEFFHAVQAAYDANQGSIMAEGTAVWATESFDPSLPDFEGFIGGYLENCARSLDVPLPGPVDPFSYGSAIFFQFLEERYGAGTVRALWERTVNGANGEANPVWFHELDPMLSARAKTTFSDAFVEFATWNLFTGRFADPARSYDAGAGYARVSIEDAALPFSSKLRVFYASSQYYRAPPGGRGAMTAALVPADSPDADAGLSLLLVPEKGGHYGDITRVDDVAAGMKTVDTSGADALVVVVVNGKQAGESRRPTLCIGTVDEVAACRKAALSAGGGGGRHEAAPQDGGCGCRAAGSGGGQSGFAAGVVALLAVARRRRGGQGRTSARRMRRAGEGGGSRPRSG